MARDQVKKYSVVCPEVLQTNESHASYGLGEHNEH